MSALSSDGLRWLIGPRLHRRLGVWINLMARILLQATPEAFVTQVRAILDASDDVRFELGRIEVPTLVITGSQDLLTPFGDAEELAELISTARLAELRGAGHALMVEQPSAYNAAVLRFLVDVVAPLSAAS
jgi:pimeloyl-ACP methyl ester carboxylesterase